MLGSSAQTYKLSEEPASDSKDWWRKPDDAKGLTAQAVAVGTKLLNGEISLETAKAYSALVRGAAQLISAEVARARSKSETPDLRF